MMRIYTLFLLGIFLLFSQFSKAQEIKQGMFQAPVTIPMVLAGNFGEIRSGHFHAGIDIKTQQKEGFPIIAAADGYVSRVKISLGGYGNCLYITHPNGYTTVYGHLQQFNDQITQTVRAKQYQEKSFTTELFYGANQILVKQGDTIAISGNSGGSGGPHLHFEIRKSKGDIPVNPLLFGLDIQDNIPPILKNVALYPLNDTSSINGKRDTLVIPLKKHGSVYKITKHQKIKAQGVVGLGLEAIDRLNGANNRCGIYQMSLYADSQLIYAHTMNEIPFGVSRYINTHVDYYQWKKEGKRIQKNFHHGYNPLPIYTDTPGNGKLFFSKYGHHIHYEVLDSYQNKTSLDFQIAADTQNYEWDSTASLPQKMLFVKSPFHFENDHISISFPPYAVYDSTPFHYSLGDTIPGGVTATHHILNLYTPLQKYMTVRIKIPKSHHENGDQLYAVSLKENLTVLSPEGGTYSNGWLTFKTRSLGPYTVLQDTIAPTLKPVTNNPLKMDHSDFVAIAHDSTLRFEITENQSGIKTYEAYLDGNWHLLEFDKKTGLVWLDFTYHPPQPGKHTLELKIGDGVNNFKQASFNFIW